MIRTLKAIANSISRTEEVWFSIFLVMQRMPILEFFTSQMKKLLPKSNLVFNLPIPVNKRTLDKHLEWWNPQ